MLDVNKLMTICNINKLNSSQLNNLKNYNKKQSKLITLNSVLMVVVVICKNSLLGIPAVILLAGFEAISIYERLNIKKSTMNLNDSLVCNKRWVNL